jgi:hypothetical protein
VGATVAGGKCKSKFFAVKSITYKQQMAAWADPADNARKSKTKRLLEPVCRRKLSKRLMIVMCLQ